jgi:hypothetical protein
VLFVITDTASAACPEGDHTQPEAEVKASFGPRVGLAGPRREAWIGGWHPERLPNVRAFDLGSSAIRDTAGELWLRI